MNLSLLKLNITAIPKIISTTTRVVVLNPNSAGGPMIVVIWRALRLVIAGHGVGN